MEASQAVGGTGRRQSRWGDAEEIEDEQRERELKARLNQDFKSFIKKLEELVRDFFFFGRENKKKKNIQPSVFRNDSPYP
jgi:nucleosome binding factor SPN SPT16 subunit